MQLNMPLPGRADQEPTQDELEREGEQFMAFMQAMKGGI